MNADLESLREQFIGRDTQYRLADGSVGPRRYLDSTASALMLKPAFDMATGFLRHYANVHSTAHISARIATHCFKWAQESVLRFLDGDPAEYVCVFVGSGATAALNRVAQLASQGRPNRGIALVSLMEHHSNDLPHRRNVKRVIHVGLVEADGYPATVDLLELERQLQEQAERVNYIAITGVSNVTGLINPLDEVAGIARRYNVPVIVDAAQMAPHMPLSLRALGPSIAAVAFSGHKMYAPGSPGVLVARRDFLENLAPVELGGGMVDSVRTQSFLLSKSLPDREHAGTPNIFGAVLLGGVCHILQRIGMQSIYNAERELMGYAHESLRRLAHVRVYGHPDLSRFPRIGALAFNIDEMPHALVAAALNDHFGIEVRNECFCAHPYVRELILDELWDRGDDEIGNPDIAAAEVSKWRGMVRASFGLCTTRDDVEALVNAVGKISGSRSTYANQYELRPDGSFHLAGRSESIADVFSPEAWLERAMSAMGRPKWNVA